MGRSYPSRPVMAVGAIVLKSDAVLLVCRGQEPQRGLWSVPGGGLELGESVRDGVVREVSEEASLDVRVVELVEVFERIARDAVGAVEFHYVVLDYLCEVTGGELIAGDDASEVAWVSIDELSQWPLTAGLLPVIEQAFAQRSVLELKRS
jgi:8-oxo-dGTP diphosphatase